MFVDHVPVQAIDVAGEAQYGLVHQPRFGTWMYTAIMLFAGMTCATVPCSVVSLRLPFDGTCVKAIAGVPAPPTVSLQLGGGAFVVTEMLALGAEVLPATSFAAMVQTYVVAELRPVAV